MECFCVGNKKRTANSNTVILFFFFSSLDLTGPLLLGGLVQLPVIFPVLYKHFTGCIRNVYIDHKFLDLSQPLYNNGTSAKCKAMGNTCAYKPCERGTCFQHTWFSPVWLSHWVWWKSLWNKYWIFFYGYVSELSSRIYFSLKRPEKYGIFWNLFKCLVSNMQTTVHELCMIKDTLGAFKCIRFLVMRNISSSLSTLVNLQLINARQIQGAKEKKKDHSVTICSSLFIPNTKTFHTWFWDFKK